VPETNNGPVIQIVGTTWKDIVMDTAKYVFVNYYAPWCPYSQRLEPIWKEFAVAVKDKPNVIIAIFDGTQNEVPGLALFAFTTTTLYLAGTNEAVQYRGAIRSVEAFTKFLEDHIKKPEEVKAVSEDKPEEKEKEKPDQKNEVQAKVDRAEMAAFTVEELTDKNFETTVYDPQKNVVVLFYATYLDDKYELLRKWKEIALEFRFVKSVNVVQMKADQQKIAEISMFPTIRMYTTKSQKGSESLTFKGKDITIRNLIEWISVSAEKSDEDSRRAVNAPNRGGAFDGFNRNEEKVQEAAQSLFYKEDL